MGLGTRQSFFAKTRHAVADQRAHDAGRRLDFADAIAILLAHIEIGLCVKTDGIGHERIRLRLQVRRRRSRQALAVAEDGGDDATLPVDSADAVVGIVADVEITLRIEGEMFGMMKGRVTGWSSIAVVAHQAETRAAAGGMPGT